MPIFQPFPRGVVKLGFKDYKSNFSGSGGYRSIFFKKGEKKG